MRIYINAPKFRNATPIRHARQTQNATSSTSRCITRRPESDLLCAQRWAPRTCNRVNTTAIKQYLRGERRTNRSSVSASRYAFNTNHPINTRSPRKNTHRRNLDHENTKCSTNSAVNSKLDCHAWNLHTSQSAQPLHPSKTRSSKQAHTSHNHSSSPKSTTRSPPKAAPPNTPNTPHNPASTPSSSQTRTPSPPSRPAH